MKGITVFLIVIVILLLIITVFILFIRNSLRRFLQEFFGTSNLKEAIEKSEIESQETPKSVASMESVLLSSIRKDFPDLNTNELKSMTENGILDYFKAIEEKDLEIVSNYNDTIKNLVSVVINDNKDKEISYSSINFHKIVVNRYEKSDSIATIVMESSLEYYYKEDNKINKKVQDRFKVEIVYVIDASKVDKEKKLLGLNCPNCGAPITSLGIKKCKYCDTGISDIIKRTWVINNMKSF